MATSPAQLFVLENRFYGRLAFWLALLILLGFGLFSALGITDITRMPRSTHLHGAVMTAWVGLFLVQNVLGAGRNLPLHRKLGWVGAGLAVFAVVTAWNTGVTSMAMGRTPPTFSHPYFLALNFIQPLVFAGFVAAAILRRKRTDWHRRLMLGALIVILEPALGRLFIIVAVPMLGGPESAMPFFAARPWALPLAEMTCQVLIVAAIMLRDRSMRGTVHPALKIVLAAIIGSYASIAALSQVPAFAGYAFTLAGMPR